MALPIREADMCKTKLIFRAVTVVAMTLAFSPAGHADCFCELINGVMQPMCGSSLDLRPRCEATIFASEPPVAALTARPVLPPFRVATCRPAVVCNGNGFCRWRRICD